MGGHFSRNKGKRNEYLIRDMFRGWGYKCDRVPSSGAAPGFKGDLKITLPDGTVKIAEVKARKDEFKLLYELLPEDMWGNWTYVLGGLQFTSDNPYLPAPYTHPCIDHPKAVRKLKGVVERYYKNCDILVVKDDRKFPIFIMVIDGNSSKEGELPSRDARGSNA